MKCCGCGVTIQCDTEKELGFLPLENYDKLVLEKRKVFCKRCFTLSNYNKDIINHRLIPSQSYNTMSLKPKRNVIIYVIDAVFFDFAVSELLVLNKNTSCELVLVFNKIDLLKNLLTEDRIFSFLKNYMGKYAINYSKMYFVSALYETNTQDISDYIKSSDPLTSFHFMGASSCGKSLLINKVFYDIKGERTDLVSSPFFKTTVEPITFVLPNNSKLLDYYGITRTDDIRYYLNCENYKNVFIDRPLKIIGYQLKNEQSVFIDGFCRFDFFGSQVISLITMCSSFLAIHKTNINKKTIDLKKIFKMPDASEAESLGESRLTPIDLKEDTAYDIIVYGLGVFRILNCEKINIEISEKVSFLIRESFI